MEISLKQINFAAGELSAKMAARDDLPVYKNGAERIVNFISETAGPARFRAGFQYAQNTRRHQIAWLLPFQFNDSDAYEMEFTSGYIRFFRNDGVVTLPAKTISGATVAAGVVTITAVDHGFSDGDEVVINGVVGMTQLNNRSFVVTNSDGDDTFDLLDNFGDALDGSSFSAYVSGGTATKIYEVATPYLIADIPHLKITQNADTLYIDHNRYESRKLTRLASNSWTLSLYTRLGVLPINQKLITGITAASPAKVTVASHGYTTGQSVAIEDVTGMTEIAGIYVITTVDGDNFTLNGVNSTNYKAYTGGGWVSNVLTDPFTDKKTITAITKAAHAVVTAVGHGYSTGQIIYIETVAGMTEINGKYSAITKIGTDTFSLDDVDSTGFTTYTSGGYCSDTALLPSCLAFYQGRLYHGASDKYSESIWGSNPLDDNGNPQYDYFLLGSLPADAFKFTLSPISAKVDKIESLIPTLNFLAAATFEGITKINGGSDGSAIDPENIQALPVVTAGCLQQITPVLLGITMLYVHRSGLILESLEFDIFYNAYNAMDKNLTNEHWPESGVAQMVYFASRPTGFWFIRNDGILIWLTYMVKETINGADRLIPGGLSAKFLSVGGMPRADKYDQAWVVTERVVNDKTCRFVEYQNDDPIFPERDDFWTGDDNEAADELRWRNAMFEAQKQYVYMDAALTYDGSDYGVAAGASLLPGALSGDGITFTASAPVFDSTMVGRELWKQAQNGVGSGRARIIQYIDSTHVLCASVTAFDTLTAIPAGQWYLTTDVVSGAWHLEGDTVSVLTDGGEHPQQEVVNGSITLEYQASVVHIGEPYFGLIRTMHLQSNSPSVPSDGRMLNVNRVAVKFLNSLGARYGTDLYNMQDFLFDPAVDLMGRPTPLFSEHLAVVLQDDSAIHKHFYIQQVRPLPCTIEEIVPFVEIDEK